MRNVEAGLGRGEGGLGWDVGRAAWAGMIVSGLGWDEECRGWSGTWGGRIREDPRGSERLGEELKSRAGDRDEICSKLESAVRALKSRISRICGINELERRTVPSQKLQNY